MIQKEWSICFPSTVFTSKSQLIRLFDIADKASGIYANADYYPLQSNIEISTLIENIYSKKVRSIL
jgi:hypothetical protein